MKNSLHAVLLLLVTLLSGGLVMDLKAGTSTPRPQGFIANVNQWPQDVLYVYQEPNLTVWIMRDGMVVDQHSSTNQERQGQVVRFRWLGASVPTTFTQSSSELPSVSYFVGNTSNKGVQATVASRVRVVGQYPGVDVEYWIDNGHVRYDLHVAKGANLSAVRMNVEGADRLEISNERVVAHTQFGAVVTTGLRSYVPGTAGVDVPSNFVQHGNGFSISISGHDASKPLVIDPIVYGTFIGGGGSDQTSAVKHTAAGVVVAGWTEGIQFPEASGRYQKSVKSSTDAFIAVLSHDLKRVLHYSYFGGNGIDKATSLTCDASGAVFVVGQTTSNDLPVSSGAAKQTYTAQIDAFVVKMPADLNRLDVCTYIGGNRDELANAVAVDVSGNIFVAGGTNSTTGFPTNLGHQKTLGGQWDGFLCRLSPNGSSFGFGTYFGKEGIETFTAMALNSSGEPHVTGSTTSSNFETAPTPGRWSSGRVPYDRTYNGGNTDAFVVKFFADGTLSKSDDGTYSTFFGGNADEVGRGIFVDQTGRAVVVGTTTSSNLPVTSGIKSQPIGQRDIFMAVFSDDGRSLASATYFGGTGNDDVLGAVALGNTATAVVYGTTTSNDFPVFSLGASSDRAGTTDGFISIINTSAVVMSTYVGGDDADSVVCASVDNSGDIYYALATTSSTLPVVDTAFQSQPTAGSDGYVAKYAAGVLGLQAPLGGENVCIGTNYTISWSAEEMLETDRYDIELTTDGGTTWSFIQRGVVSRSYQWRPDASLTPSATNRIRVSSPRGHLSTGGNFSLLRGPSVVTSPADVAVCAGSSVELSVQAEGSGLKYQWRKDGQNINGATQATLVIASVGSTNTGSYDVVVSGTCNPSSTSKAARVTASAPTAISTQPKGVTVESGKGFSLTVAATGSALQYQWKKDGSAITGATQSTYTIASSALSDAGEYMCEVTGGCGVANSATARVEVTPSTSVTEDVTVDGRSLRLMGPHPASSSVRFVVTDPVGGTYTLEIKDVRGQTVQTLVVGAVLGSTNVDLDVSTLPSGFYAATLLSEGVGLSVPIFVLK